MRLSLFQGRVASAGGTHAPSRRTRVYQASALTMAVSILAIVVGSIMLSGLAVPRSAPEAWEYVGAWSLQACISAPVTFVLAYVGLRAGGALLRSPNILWAYVRLALLGAGLGAVAGWPWLLGAILAIGNAAMTIETNRMLQVPVIIWAAAGTCTGIGLALARRRLQSIDIQETLRFVLSAGLVSLAVAAVTAGYRGRRTG